MMLLILSLVVIYKVVFFRDITSSFFSYGSGTERDSGEVYTLRKVLLISLDEILLESNNGDISSACSINWRLLQIGLP